MKLFCIFCLLFCSLSTFGQQPAHSIFWEKQFEGVDIYHMIQDLDYNYWFATDQGLYKHDGYSFEKVECAEMKGESVFNFLMNSQGVIYCMNLNQQVFQIKDGVCTVVFNFPKPSPNNFLIMNHSDELVVSDSEKLFVLNKENQVIHTSDHSINYSHGSTFVLKNGEVIAHRLGMHSVISYSNKKTCIKPIKFAVGTQQIALESLQFFRNSTKTYAIDRNKKRVYEFNEKTFELKHSGYLEWNPVSEVPRFYQIEELLWLGSNISGVSSINLSHSGKWKFDKIFNDYYISYVYKDREGNYLLSTFDQGVIVIPSLNVPDVKEALTQHSVTRFYSEKKGDLFLGTRNGLVIRYDSLFHEAQLVGDKRIEALFKLKGTDIVVTDGYGGCGSYDFKSGTITTSIIGSLKDFAQLNSNEFVIGLNSGLYRVHLDDFDHIVKDQQYISERVYKIALASTTKYMYVSSSKGLNYVHIPSGKVRSLLYQNLPIQAIYMQTSGDKTYISTRSRGILVYQSGKLVDRFTPLHNGTALYLYKFILHENLMYANTQHGLIVLNKKGKIVRYIDRSVGLSANKIVDFEIHNNQLWVSHSRGVQVLNLSNLKEPVTPPKLILSGVFVNNGRHKMGLKDKFGSSDKKFQFEFKVPTLKYRDNIVYHFKLEGVSNEWTTQSYENHQVTYNALAPGNYRFIVKAESNGFFSSPIYYSFSISAPYYQRWWFIASICAFVLFIITLVYKRQLTIQARKAKHINELNASRLTAIQSQMNPHFIFNSLNSIQDLVLRGDIDNSYGFITKFSHLVRRTLNYSDKDFIEFEQEVKLIELYLSLEKLRFKEDLSYTIETGDVDGILIPPMLIQPFIENALVHGLLHKKGEKKLSIRFYLDGSLFCEVIDNGIGRDRAKEIKKRQRSTHESFSVNAIKQRFEILEAHFKEELGFTYYDLMENGESVGTKVVLKLPTNYRF